MIFVDFRSYQGKEKSCLKRSLPVLPQLEKAGFELLTTRCDPPPSWSRGLGARRTAEQQVGTGAGRFGTIFS